MKISGIYKIVNKVNGKYYVGSSKNINYRWRRHKWELRLNKHTNDYLQRSWNKYSENNFEFQIVELASENQLLEKEQEYLNEIKNEKDKCYNLNPNSSGGNWSEYSKKKFSLKRIKSGNPMYGKFHSKKTKMKMSKSMEGKNIGINNPFVDKSVYKFYNENTKDVFVGLQCEFYKRFNLKQSNVSNLIKKRNKSYRGWVTI